MRVADVAAAVLLSARAQVHRSTPGGWTYIAELCAPSHPHPQTRASHPCAYLHLPLTHSLHAPTHTRNSDRGMQVHKMDHLACFVPGMLVLGAQGDVAARYVALAKDLSDTCVQMYAGTATGLAPELVNFRDGRDMFTNDRSAHNLLRPETVESLFYLYRKTGDAVYREQGWAIFTAFEAHCRLPGGYAGVRDVRVLPAVNDDTQQSFFLAETLKYLFLLFSDSDTVSLEEWVFNTEAHPLRVTRRDTSLLAEAEEEGEGSDGTGDENAAGEEVLEEDEAAQGDEAPRARRSGYLQREAAADAVEAEEEADDEELLAAAEDAEPQEDAWAPEEGKEGGKDVRR
jgi:hypothetical protein